MLNYKKIKDLRNMILIKQSGLFDQNYYKKEYPEAGKKTLEHYYYEGYKKGNNPSKKFDNDYYLINNPDVKANNINPLLHYIISGENEGRRIKKAIGITIPKLYKSITKNDYSYSISLKNSNKKRITIFLERLNKDSLYIFDIIKKCQKDNFMCRIIYKEKIDYSLFKKFNNNNINSIEFTKWNNNYLLEVYKNELFICSDYNILISLLNTNYINKPIYYYINNEYNYSDKEIKFLSLLIDNNYIKCIGNNLELDKYKLKTNNKYYLQEKNINICIVFDEFVTEMFDILQTYITKNKMTSHINLFYHSNNGLSIAQPLKMIIFWFDNAAVL